VMKMMNMMIIGKLFCNLELIAYICLLKLFL